MFLTIDAALSGRATREMKHPMERHQPGTHQPILVDEVLRALQPAPDSTIVDGTFGGGGHSREICKRIAPGGRLIAIDRDPAAVERAQRLAEECDARVDAVHASYAEISSVLEQLQVERVDGILLDLGLSSIQLDEPERGFSFRSEGPLDMRFDPTQGEPASDLIARLPERELADLIYQFGEERRSRRIARAIVAAREEQPIETTQQLEEIVFKAAGGRRSGRIHSATRTFQALRIAVNDELGELERGLRAGIDVLAPGGRFAVIAFHSLEDRIVKRTFTEEVQGCICPPEQPICTCGRVQRVRWVERLIRPDADEVQRNPRARSARLRVVERLP